MCLFGATAGNLFSDPESQNVENEEDLPENLSDDDDDAKLTTNQKVAIDMAPPARLKKADKNILIKGGKGVKNPQAKVVEFDEPITTAQRLEALHLQQKK